MATVELKNSEWKNFISDNEYAIIDCYGDDCVACVILEPVYDALADDLDPVAFGRVNITHYPEIADVNDIDAMPTLLYFRNGKQVDTTIGSLEKDELEQHISKLLYGSEETQ